MDGRANNGGNKNAGRKTKDEEGKLIERLDAIINSDEAIEVLKNKIRIGDMRAIQLYFNYRFGKPKENVTLSSDGLSINFKDLLKFE